ncbi:MAG: DUF6542 domain-containing protein [Actinocrinis sp.]
MSHHRAAAHRPPGDRLWHPEPTAAHGAASGAGSARGRRAQQPDGARPVHTESIQRAYPTNVAHRANGSHGTRRAGRPPAFPSVALPLAGGGPLTAVGVSIVLAGACLIGAALDLVLVSTAAWALTALFLAASVYTAVKVRRSDWYSAVVGPPLAFACGLLLIAAFLPHDLGSGLTGTFATMLELLAYKARSVFVGTGLALCITIVRGLPFRR